MVIKIPRALTPLVALNFSKTMGSLHREKEFIYDFSDMQHCPPFGMLITANAIKQNKVSFPQSFHTAINYDKTQGCEVAANFGFFQMCDWDIGRKTTAESYGATYIPIKKISIKDLQSKYLQSTLVLGEMIERYSQDLAITLTQNAKSPLTATFRYCLREIIRNSYEHGNTEEVWICGEYWESKEKAEIAIIDEGRGIWHSLRQNRHYNPRNDKEANKLALQPGVTRTYGQKQDPMDVWSNSGYGLYTASSVCCCGGSFWLCSGDDATLVNRKNQINYNIKYKGTAVCMNIDTTKIPDIETILPEITKAGESQAKRFGDARVLTASKVSTIASLMSDIN